MDGIHILALILALCIYFIPSIIAVLRGHINTAPIILINIFLGWSFLGWIGSLAWALSHFEEKMGVKAGSYSRLDFIRRRRSRQHRRQSDSEPPDILSS
ncbi:MAG: superinfection immunity protein [Planctomycetota bacterium]